MVKSNYQAILPLYRAPAAVRATCFKILSTFLEKHGFIPVDGTRLRGKYCAPKASLTPDIPYESSLLFAATEAYKGK